MFVFSPRDGVGVDIIKDFTITAGDQIDLSAFGIDRDDLAANISIHDDDFRIDLADFGGGIIILEDHDALDVDLDNLDLLSGLPNDTEDVIDSLDTGDDGIFII